MALPRLFDRVKQIHVTAGSVDTLSSSLHCRATDIVRTEQAETATAG